MHRIKVAFEYNLRRGKVRGLLTVNDKSVYQK